MKKLLMIAALISMSAPALASKARSAAIGMSRTTSTNVQQLFEQPSKMFEVGDLVTIEYGKTGTTYDTDVLTAGTGAYSATNSTHAEGGFFRSHNNAKYGVYFGHQTESFMYLASGGRVGKGLTVDTTAPVTGSNLRQLENPFNVFYGMKGAALNWGFNLYYADSENEAPTMGNKKSAMGVSFGASADKWNANAVVGLGAKVESNTSGTDQEEFKATSNFKVAGEYMINDNMVGYGHLIQLGGKHTTAAGTEDSDLTVSEMSVGVESKVKSDTVHFFYGASLANTTEKNGVTGGSKAEALLMPVYFGAELDAASWLVLRSSLKQNVLLDTVKISGTSDTKFRNDSTVATLGAGLKFGKLSLDGTLAAGTSGTLSAVDFLTQTSMTYMF